MPVLVALGVDLALFLPSDASIYHHFANMALARPLFHSLPKEYPAASVAVFLVPLLIPLPYQLGFTLLATVATVALLLSSDGLDRYPGWPRRAAIYFFVGTVAILFSRYDIFPTLAAFLAVEAARKASWGRAWTWAVLGGVLKLFPFLLLPGFLLAERARTGRWPVRRLVVTCTPLALLASVQSLLSPGSLLSPILYEAHRGFMMASTAGSLTLLTDPLHVKWVSAYQTLEIIGSYHTLISLSITVATLAGLCAIWRLARTGRISVEATALAVFSVALLGDKVFSPQYPIWLVPFWAYWPLRRGWLASAALSTFVFPLSFFEAAYFGPGYYVATGAAVVRNAVLLIATVRWLQEEVRGQYVPLRPLTSATLLPSDNTGISLPNAKALQAYQGRLGRGADRRSRAACPSVE
jgi:hypothetical protein